MRNVGKAPTFEQIDANADAVLTPDEMAALARAVVLPRFTLSLYFSVTSATGPGRSTHSSMSAMGADPCSSPFTRTEPSWLTASFAAS